MDKRDQVSNGEDPSKKTCLDSTPNELVQNCIRLAETSSRTGEDDHQRTGDKRVDNDLRGQPSDRDGNDKG